MDSLTPEQRLKVENLVVGKFYKLLPSEHFPKRNNLMVARLHKFDLTNNILTFALPVFEQKYPGSCEFDMLIGRHQMVSGLEIDKIIPIDAPRGTDWSINWKKYLSEIACPPAPINYNVNEPLSPENWESREATRALGVPWSKPGTTGGGSAIPVTVDGSTVPRTREKMTAEPVTGGGSAAATSSKKKKTRSERRNRKTRKASRR